MKKILLTTTIVLAAFSFSYSQVTPGWCRYSAISPDGKSIVFTYKGDLYKVPSTGGSAIPLTQHEARDFMPVWSHDGKYIAFASDRFGNYDIFVMPSGGGVAKRLTYFSNNEYPYAFSSDNQTVIFGGLRMDVPSNRNYPAYSQPELYKVNVNGGRVEQVLSTPAEDVNISKDGSHFLYHDKKGGENPWRKHHVSAIARDIWIYDMTSGIHKKITSFAGEDRNPVFTDNDNAFFYLSEESGSFNVHLMNLDGTGGQQITHFKKHPIRFLSMSTDGILCFSYNGELYTKTPDAEPQKVTINISSDSKSNNEELISVNGGVRELAVSPNGKEVAYIFRGEVFVSSVEGSTTKRITRTAGQERSVGFSPDGRHLIYSSERGQRWTIYQAEISRKDDPYFYASTLIRETALVENENENYLPEYSPDGKEVAFIENRTTLKILNLASRQTRTILTSTDLFSWGDNDQHFNWSPDGKWIAFDYAVEGAGNGEIGLISADGKGKPVNLTENGFNDGNASWMMGGKMILYGSEREGLRAKANSGGSQSDAFAIFLTQDAWDKFRLNSDEYTLVKEQDDRNEKADSSKNKIKKDTLLTIDWDGLKYRKARLTINSSDLGDAIVSRDGQTLYYLSRFEKGYNLWTTNLRTKETKIFVPLNAESAVMSWDKDQKNIFLLSDGSISRIDTSSGKRLTVNIHSEMNLDVAAERLFMFEHVWRRTKTTFYTASFHGVDWDSYKADYERYLPHIGDNYEFAEMLSELLGELNVSHSGSTYYPRNPNADATASLGAFYDLNYKGIGVKITEVIKEGPLDKAGIHISPGTIIEAIDGDTLSADKDIAQFLNRKADMHVLLSLIEGKNRREVIVKPVSLGEEYTLLYNRWVRRNQDEVDRMSNGTLGYVHIPGMDDEAYRVVYEDIMGKYSGRKGMVIDTRFNGGGDLVSDLATFLTGKAYLINANDKRVVSYEPTFRWTKPSIALANEANYSDGHCFAFGYQNLQIGKLVGMPTPGTCTYAGWELLQDNSLRWGVPPVGVKRMSGTYLENAQTTPDILVRNEYEVVIKGKDQQLEAAVNELLSELKAIP